jgi:glycosyltransferase involved in cell wall biosynthesis
MREPALLFKIIVTFISPKFHIEPMGNRYVIIAPVRDEAAYVSGMIESVIRQTARPEELIIVDDGSTDGTAEIISGFLKGNPWITLVRLPDRGHRLVGRGVVEAFYAGLARLAKEWDFIVKMDADVSFGPRYFELLLRRFAQDAELGMASGHTFTIHGSRLVRDRLNATNVSGAIRAYRQSCYRQINGLVPHAGWDSIDITLARMHGWKTMCFSDLSIVMHRPAGKSAGWLRGMFRTGAGTHYAGYHPLFALARCIRQMTRRPRIVGGAAYFLGYLARFLQRAKQYPDPEFRAFLRREQMRRLFSLDRNI